MDGKRREELQELIRTEPGVADTFATVDAEHQEAAAHTKTLANARRPLMQKLEAIAAAKEELAEAGPPTETVEQAEDDTAEDELDSETESEDADEVEDEAEEQ